MNMDNINKYLINRIIILFVFLIFGCQQEVPNNKSYLDFTNDPNFPAFNKELIFTIKGDTVSGYAFIANDSTLKETIILVQGYPGNDNNFDLAQVLRRNGKNVIHFNHRGAWGSQGNYTYSNCLEDIDEVIKYILQVDIQKKLKIDPDKITLIGRSYGGGISLIQGSKNNSVKKIIAISSVNYGAIMKKYKTLDELSGFKKYMEKQIMIHTNIDSFLQEMLDNKDGFDILSYQEALKNKPVLIIEDSDKNDNWTKHLSQAEIVKFESGHSFIDKRIEMIDLIVNWLTKEES